MNNLDFTTEANERVADLVPRGRHAATITEAEHFPSKAGNQMLAVTWSLADDSGRVVRDLCMYEAETPSSMLRAGRAKINAALKVGNKAFEFETVEHLILALVGIPASIEVEHEPDRQGAPQEVVRAIYPAALERELPSSTEPDDEDEEVEAF